LGVRLVDVTSLAAAVVINSIPQGTNKFILAGKITKVACTVASVLCKKNVEVITKYPYILYLHFNQYK
jgi:aldehyde decarbonylase